MSTLFWRLAQGSGQMTERRDPESVVHHLLAVLDALQGVSHDTAVGTDALTFLLELEHDPYYASPEQTRGGEKNSQSLVYSIGVLLFERLTGHHPFVESLSPMRCAIVRDRGTRVGRNNLCSLPRSLRELMQRAMSPFPEDRLRDVDQLRSALDMYLGISGGTPHLPPTKRRVRALGSQPAAHAEAPATQHEPARGRRLRARGSAPPPCPGSERRPHFEAWIPRAPKESRTAPVSRSTQAPSSTHLHPSTAISSAAAPMTMTTMTTTPAMRALPRAARANPLAARNRRFSRTALASLTAVLVLGGASALLALLVLGGDHFGAPAALSAATTDKAVQRPADAANESSYSDGRPTHYAAPRRRRIQVPRDTVLAAASAPRGASDSEDITHSESTDGVFNPTIGGARASEAALACASPQKLNRGVELGVSIRFSAKSGGHNRVYFSPGLSRAERQCMKAALSTISAGARPTRGTTVSYTLWASRAGSTHRVHRIE